MPGPGGYDMKSMAFPTDKPFSFMGRAIKGNHQTTLQNAVLSEWNTVTMRLAVVKTALASTLNKYFMQTLSCRSKRRQIHVEVIQV